MLQLCLPGSLIGTQGQDPFMGPGAHLELSVPLGHQQNVPISLAALCGYSFAVPLGTLGASSSCSRATDSSQSPGQLLEIIFFP